MVYLDTSVLVALCTHEAKSAAVSRWYAKCSSELVSAAWCVTEFASALALKQRTGQLGAAQVQTAWRMFESLCANDLRLLPVAPETFYQAARLTLGASTGLRAGDALHLACAIHVKAKRIATLDAVLAKSAQALKLKPTVL